MKRLDRWYEAECPACGARYTVRYEDDNGYPLMRDRLGDLVPGCPQCGCPDIYYTGEDA